MEVFILLLAVAQFAFTVICGLYFYKALKKESKSKNIVTIESKKDVEHLNKLRKISLTEPLSEKIRPKKICDILGQEEGIEALRALICGENPQHILIYGPPGVGKTAAARLILEEAKKRETSPFSNFSKFVEIDATTLRYDERNIADPLMGSVHDPIYQGAGAYGQAGIPQPKEGAVTKAHGGILFIDEIGELSSVQMNKLLKVLEDRKVMLNSSYYSESNTNIPPYIHDIFKNGLPADFRLIGATTKSPESIPPALRSRCSEIFFNELKESDIIEIAKNAALSAGVNCEASALNIIGRYALNGRDASKIIQTAVSVVKSKDKNVIEDKDINWVVKAGRFVPRKFHKLKNTFSIGKVNGLAVFGYESGCVLPIETVALKNDKGKGTLNICGIIEQEEITKSNGMLSRKSTIRSSIENAVSLIKNVFGLDVSEFDINVNFPGGAIVDGPSAGIAIFMSIYSAIFKKEICDNIVMTGEISILGDVLPVGGVRAKIEAAVESGAKMILIPIDNWEDDFSKFDIDIKTIKNIDEALNAVFGVEKVVTNSKNDVVLSAKSI